MKRVESLVALVTGAAQGLGLAIAKRLAAEGATVIVTDINQEAGALAAAAFGASFVHQDTASEDDWKRVCALIEQRHGRLDIQVNNAGIEGDPNAMKEPDTAPLEDWERIFKVNAAGVFLACKHGIPLIAKSGGGSIINISSIASLVPTPFITAYGAAKSAVQHLSRSVALHCAAKGQKIRCNSVHPGQILTPMLSGLLDRLAAQTGATRADLEQNFLARIPLGVFQEEIDVANLVLFLASEESRYITGQCIAVDGGMTLTN
ncbi:MAG: glucose 1-dehydrogenase [Betaproteobacteria bacterium]|nr:glucose 1-dehydrogenase [Betaproteobacteria bacterium]